MRFEYSVLTVLATLAAVHSQDVDNNDIPNQCRDICAPVVALSTRCDTDNDNYIQCVCNAQEVNTVPACEACVNFYDNDNNDNDVNDIRTSCNLPTATFNPSSTQQGGAGPTSAPNTQPTAGTTVVGGVGSSATSAVGSATSAVGSGTSAVGSGVSSVTSRAGSAGAGATSTASSVVASFTGGAAAMAPPVGAAAAAILGLANLL
ncbi:hypothetical protein C1H76_3297 [Elsinoe australis]|uniref:Gpi anchored protein n=1 Tax=Elsinoe australis TaxID=40998 RepID=A0A4U7BA73_9PEZI|nr:hypothetical protein C1H76_3297 [Elsinoe australis]